jgi:hypothetical protein
MNPTSTLLASVLTDVVNAVTSTQKEMDRLANESPGDLPLAPLAFVVKQTEVTLLGSLSVQRGDASATRDSALSFALVNRVQASLQGSHGANLSTRVSVSIQAVEPPHGR